MKYHKTGRGRYKLLVRKDSKLATNSSAHPRTELHTEVIGHGLLLVGATVNVFVVADKHHIWALGGYALLLFVVLLRLRK